MRRPVGLNTVTVSDDSSPRHLTRCGDRGALRGRETRGGGKPVPALYSHRPANAPVDETGARNAKRRITLGVIDRGLIRCMGASRNPGRVGQGILCEMCDLT
jgi:hypothetical protein